MATASSTAATRGHRVVRVELAIRRSGGYCGEYCGGACCTACGARPGGPGRPLDRPTGSRCCTSRSSRRVCRRLARRVNRPDDPDDPDEPDEPDEELCY